MDFFRNSGFFDSLGALEVHGLLIVKEAVEFHFPCVIRIIEKRIENGGLCIFVCYFQSTFLTLCTIMMILIETKFDPFTASCVHTLWNHMGHVSQWHGKHFIKSRQTLHLAAFFPRSVEITDETGKGYPGGGLMFVPEDSIDALSGQLLFLLLCVGKCNGLQSFPALKC